MEYQELMEYINLYFTTGVRWVCVGLAALILMHQILSLLKMRNPSEIWAYLRCPDGTSVPLTHWENLIGRSRGCDIILNLNSVSRSHATLIRDADGVWRYHDLNSRNGSFINGIRVYEPTVLKGGDQLTIGGEDFELYPVSLKERMANVERRKRRTHPVSPWPSLVMLTIFQALTVIQFHISLENQFSHQITASFALLCVLMWFYVILMRIFKRNGFEMEVIAFFLSTLCLAVTVSYDDTSAGVFKQAIAICLGVALFFFLCWYLRDLNHTKRITYILLGFSTFLLLINLLFGTVANGAQNWISIGGFSFQPSELIKIVFIYVGAATLDELQERRSLYLFMGFSVFCLGALALMGDFGTAIIFFVTFLVISFLRSGDFTKLFLILGAAGLMGLMVLRFRSHVASRFAVWGHVWEDPTDKGFQQVQTMTSIASGGLPGLGAGEGNLGSIFGAGTDLVFGMLGEEWGLIIAVLAVLCIITLGIFAFRSITAGRSTYYSIAACSTTALFMFQTILNVFGSLDLLPLTGVTFPFLSAGGTSMIASWGLLAFLKAADTRQNASFAIRLDRKSDFKDQLSEGDFQNPEEIFNDIDGIDGMSSAELADRMEHDPEFQKFWEAQQAMARAEADRQEAAEAASRRRRKGRAEAPVEPSGMTDSHPDPREPVGNEQPSPQRPAGGPVYQMPWQEPAPAPAEPAPQGFHEPAPDYQAEGYGYPDNGGQAGDGPGGSGYGGYAGQAGSGYDGYGGQAGSGYGGYGGQAGSGYGGYGGQAGGGEYGYDENADPYGQPSPRRREPDRPRSKSYRNVDDDAFFRSFGDNRGPAPAEDVRPVPEDGEEQPVTLDDLFGGDDR